MRALYPHDSLFQRLAAARWSRYALRFARAAAKRLKVMWHALAT